MSKKHIVIAIIVAVLFAGGYYIYTLGLPSTNYFTAGWILVVFAFLVFGNRLISSLFDKKLPWLRFGKTRLFSHLFIGLLYSLVVINVAYLIFKLVFTLDAPVFEQLVVMNVYGLVIFIPVFCIYFSLHFLQHWQHSEVQAERFKKEKLKSEIDNLKNHLDPHFLFNNLNILAALIDQDAEESKKFLDKFTEVYRSLLKTKDEDLVYLSDELEFVNAYIYLLNTRFEDLVVFDIQVDNEMQYHMIPPLSIQQLIENAIKHNIITEKQPLKINIYSDEQFLVVKNTLRKKEVGDALSMGSGLSSIKSRFSYFSDIEVEVTQTDDEFVVKLPIIEVETV